MTTKLSDCPFCTPDPEREIIVESATVYSIYDKFPVNDGHALIIPKRHCEDYFNLTFQDQSDCFLMLNKVKEIVSLKFNPDGFNIGINVGEKAGQTIQHVHIHLIPRFNGDVEEPKGGVRGVIPNKQKY
jgi:diadenosine tetraphosphate (Ap4A) HIT family hydrolase